MNYTGATASYPTKIAIYDEIVSGASSGDRDVNITSNTTTLTLQGGVERYDSSTLSTTLYFGGSSSGSGAGLVVEGTIKDRYLLGGGVLALYVGNSYTIDVTLNLSNDTYLFSGGITVGNNSG